MSAKKNAIYVLKHASSLEIYVIDTNNKLMRLCCPFSVTVIFSVGDLSVGQKLNVTQVKTTIGLITVFIIKGKAYFYYYFEINSKKM